jgi:hypothetical protein
VKSYLPALDTKIIAGVFVFASFFYLKFRYCLRCRALMDMRVEHLQILARVVPEAPSTDPHEITTYHKRQAQTGEAILGKHYHFRV